MFLFQIVEVEMPFDKTKNQRKGFCFITFESEQVVNELLKTPKQTINGKAVSFIELLSMSVKLAPPPLLTKNQNGTYARIKCYLCANYML